MVLKSQTFTDIGFLRNLKGRKVGDICAALERNTSESGAGEDVVAGEAEVVTVGGATVPAAILATHGTSVLN